MMLQWPIGAFAAWLLYFASSGIRLVKLFGPKTWKHVSSLVQCTVQASEHTAEELK